MKHSDRPHRPTSNGPEPARTLSLRATAIALDRNRRPEPAEAHVTDIQRLLVWYYRNRAA